MIFVEFIDLNTPNIICSRPASRVVRKEFNKIIEKANISSIPILCPLNPKHDLLLEHEARKSSDSAGHPICTYCGKAFYTENFLDEHLQRKHAHILNANATCFAHYCDIFRCSIILQHHDLNTFCDEKLFKKLASKCRNFLKLCIPDNLSVSEKWKIFLHLNTSLCSYLTCEKYHIIPDASPHRFWLVTYIVMSVFILFALFIVIIHLIQKYYDRKLREKRKIKIEIEKPQFQLQDITDQRLKRRKKLYQI